MAVPQQVQAAADRAEEMLKKHQGGEIGEEVKEPEEDQPENDEVVKPKAEPEKEESETEAPKEPSDDSGEIERLRRENQTLTSLNKSLDNENRHLKIKCREYERQTSELRDEVERAKTEKKEPAKPLFDFSDDEKALLEEEGISENVLKMLAGKLTPQGRPDGFDRLEQEVKTTKQETADLKRERFYLNLTNAVPDWEAVNKDHGFLSRLGENVPYQSYTYQQLMDDAAGRCDSATVAQIFKDLRPVKTEPKPKPKLEDLAEPQAQRGSQTPKKDGEKWDSKRISEFYKVVRNNPTKYTPEQIQAIEKKHIY